MRTETTLTTLVEALLRNCGDLFDASRQAGVSLLFVRQWMKDDNDVAVRITEAERAGAMGLQSEAIRRATRGVEEDVFFKGEVVGQRIVYSDGLLTKLLAGRLPETFGKEAEAGGNTFNGPTQINIMPRAASYDEWLSMRDSTLALRKINDAAAALPAPDLCIEAEAVPVSRPFEGLGL